MSALPGCAARFQGNGRPRRGLRYQGTVCAVGANDGRRRELDNVVLERAAFVCCDSRENAKRESADLVEPVDSGVLDWLEVHELQEVVAAEVGGRQSDEDIVVFKSNGLAAWDVAAAAAVASPYDRQIDPLTRRPAAGAASLCHRQIVPFSCRTAAGAPSASSRSHKLGVSYSPDG